MVAILSISTGLAILLICGLLVVLYQRSLDIKYRDELIAELREANGSAQADDWRGSVL